MKASRIDELKQQAKDLRQEEPRPSQVTLGGIQGAARVLDKCRASLVGWEGDYEFGCPSDRAFAERVHVDLNEFKDVVATGASDEEVGSWLQRNASQEAGSR